MSVLITHLGAKETTARLVCRLSRPTLELNFAQDSICYLVSTGPYCNRPLGIIINLDPMLNSLQNVWVCRLV